MRTPLPLTDLLVFIACLVVVAALLLSLVAPLRPDPRKINCRGNLRAIHEALRIWEEDNDGQYPMTVSTNQGGGREMISSGNVAGCLEVMSNEFGSTRLLICPDDRDCVAATSWSGLSNSNLSYFVSRDVTNGNNPDLILDGDDNFESDGSPVKAGLFEFSANTPVEWTTGRHSESYRPHFWSSPQRIYFGTIGFADGHVEQLTAWQLNELLQNIDRQTNRIAIP